MDRDRIKFYIEKDSFWAEGAVILMGLAIVFRLIGCWGLWTDEFFAITQIALPVVSGLLFILLLVLLGKHALWTTALPVLLGVAFFIVKAFTFESTVHTVLCVLLYVLVAILYVGTVFTLIRTKWLLVPLFGLPFLYHIFVEDLRALQDTAHPVTFAAGMQEMSVLCIMLALFFTACGMKKKVKEPKASRKKDKKDEESAPEKAEEQPVQEQIAPEAESAPEPLPESAAETPAAPQTEESGEPAAQPTAPEAESAPDHSEERETEAQA